MQITLTNLQKQVDGAIDARITALSQSAYVQANRLASGRMRKIYVPFTHPQEVQELLAMKQRLYAGEDAEGIMAELTNGEMQHAFLKAKENVGTTY